MWYGILKFKVGAVEVLFLLSLTPSGWLQCERNSGVGEIWAGWKLRPIGLPWTRLRLEISKWTRPPGKKKKNLQDRSHLPMQANYGIDEPVIKFLPNQESRPERNEMEFFIIYSRATVQRVCVNIIYNHFHPSVEQQQQQQPRSLCFSHHSSKWTCFQIDLSTR